METLEQIFVVVPRFTPLVKPRMLALAFASTARLLGLELGERALVVRSVGCTVVVAALAPRDEFRSALLQCE